MMMTFTFSLFPFQQNNPCTSTASEYCQNGGTCLHSSTAGVTRCLCGAEFTGQRCESILCGGQACPENSRCDSGRCVCEPGFVGKKIASHWRFAWRMRKLCGIYIFWVNFYSLMRCNFFHFRFRDWITGLTVKNQISSPSPTFAELSDNVIH